MYIFKFFSLIDIFKYNLNIYFISYNKVDFFVVRVVFYKFDKFSLVFGVKYVFIFFNIFYIWLGLKKILRFLKENNILFFVEEFIKV